MISRVERQAVSFKPELFLNIIFMLSSYRIGMRINEVMQLSDGGYYLCPRCRVTLERDFQTYCDRCGQRLDWANFRKATVIYPGDKTEY